MISTPTARQMLFRRTEVKLSIDQKFEISMMAIDLIGVRIMMVYDDECGIVSEKMFQNSKVKSNE